MQTIKSLVQKVTKVASDPLDIPAALKRTTGPAVKTNGDAALIKAAEHKVTKVEIGMTAAKAKKSKLPAGGVKSTRVLKADPYPKPTKKQTLADDAVKSVAKPAKKAPVVRKMDYDIAANEALAKAGKPPSVGPWSSYLPHRQKALDLAVAGKYDEAEKVMSSHRNVSKNRDMIYGLIRIYIKAKKS
jgi:hypothetical protein